MHVQQKAMHAYAWAHARLATVPVLHRAKLEKGVARGHTALTSGIRAGGLTGGTTEEATKKLGQGVC